MRRKLITVLILSCFAVGTAALSKVANSHSVGNPAVLQKQARRSRRPARPSAITNGIRITVLSIEAVGQSWSDGSEQTMLEAGEGKEILVMRLNLRSTPALRGKAEVEISKPTLFLDEGRTGSTNLAGFKLFQNYKQPINQEMEIPFIVPEGAEPQALTVGDAALDLTTLTVIEPTIDPAAAAREEEWERRKEMSDRAKLLRQIDEQREKTQRMLRPIPTPTPYQIKISPQDLEALREAIRFKPSPSPSPSP